MELVVVLLTGLTTGGLTCLAVQVGCWLRSLRRARARWPHCRRRESGQT